MNHSTSDAPQTLSKNDSVALWVLIFAAFVTLLNETLMNVALPVLMRELDVTPSTGQWLTAGFLLTMAVVIPITGTLIQRFATRTLFAAALGTFITGTLLAAIAPNFFVLLAGRIIQASGTAVIMPLLMTTSIMVVPPQRRGEFMGRVSVVISLAPALGPTVSGLVLHMWSWRLLFALTLPVSIAILAVGLWKMRNIGETRKLKIDILSVLLSACGFGGVVYGCSAIGENAQGGHAINPAVPLTLGVIALALFVWRQLALIRADRPPLLDLRVFKIHVYRIAAVLLCIALISLFGMVILMPLFCASVLRLETLQIGLLMLPGGLLQAVLGPQIGKLVDARGARFVLLFGMSGICVALWMLAFVHAGTPLWYLLLAHISLSIGLAGTFTPVFSASLGSLPRQLASHGSATNSTVQQLSGGVGTALFVTIMSLGSSAALSQGASRAAALTQGVQTAFLVGALLSCVAVLIAVFTRFNSAAADGGTQ